MPLYQYTAKDGSGHQTTGSVEAETDSSAVSRLREQGLWVTDLRETGRRLTSTRPQQEDSLGQRLKSPVSPKDLSLFYRQLYTLLNSGVALYHSLEMLSQSGQTPNPHLRRATQFLGQHILAGGRLSEGMTRFPRIFDRMQVRMVEAGEAGGVLVAIFQRLSDYLEREHHIRSEVARKTLYPKLVLGLLVFVLPIGFPMTLAGYLRDLGRILLWIFGLGIPAWFTSRLFFTSRGGREMYDQVKLSFPIVGKLIRKMAVARFARSFAALYGAGVPIASALAMSGEASGNYVLEQQSLRMVPHLERGMPISKTLEATGFFPPMFTGMVATGESTGSLDTMLDKAADFYEEESSHATQQLVVTLGVVLLLAVAIMVAYKVATFYASLYGGLSTGGMGGGDGTGE
ncbi:MAG: epsF 2 [Armatimonadetes bacterium]|jgi:type IV pilus assembly protein PilC|nr:epsF 2 [Armatimonadota bacterium]